MIEILNFLLGNVLGQVGAFGVLILITMYSLITKENKKMTKDSHDDFKELLKITLDKFESETKNIIHEELKDVKEELKADAKDQYEHLLKGVKGVSNLMIGSLDKKHDEIEKEGNNILKQFKELKGANENIININSVNDRHPLS